MRHESYSQQAQTSPCEGCTRPCNYVQCRDYRLWLNRRWNHYRHWQDIRPPAPRRENVWCYPAPSLVQHYLDVGPCGKCPIRNHCPDDHRCAAYDHWQALRWERLRYKLGVR